MTMKQFKKSCMKLHSNRRDISQNLTSVKKYIYIPVPFIAQMFQTRNNADTAEHLKGPKQNYKTPEGFSLL